MHGLLGIYWKNAIYFRRQKCPQFSPHISLGIVEPRERWSIGELQKNSSKNISASYEGSQEIGKDI